MLMQRVLDRNPALIDAAVRLHQDGHIPANTWLYDLDAIAVNAALQARTARELGLVTYVMTKQYARNPMVTMVALSQGLHKTVSVDIHCARLLHRHGVPIGHVGHLNQIPRQAVGHALDMEPELFTVYSVEAARHISAIAGQKGLTQDLLMRVYAPDDVFFAGQEGGFREVEAVAAAREIAALPHVRLVGTTSFPCLAYSFAAVDGGPRLNPNMATIVRAARRIESELSVPMTVINAPGNTSTEAFPILKAAGATHVEPGHGLHGTTPYQIVMGAQPELPTYVYVTEISHHYEGRGYAFAGGLWSLMAHFLDPDWRLTACVGTDPESVRANQLDYEHLDQIIDYHLPLTQGDRCQIGDTVVFPIYTQAQMTRTHVAAVSGVASGDLHVWGVFDHGATMLDDNYEPAPLTEVRAQMAELVQHYAPAAVSV